MTREKLNEDYRKRNEAIFNRFNELSESVELKKDVIDILCAEFYLSYGAIKAVLTKTRREHGIFYQQGQQPKTERNNQLINDYKSGMRKADIMRKYDISYGRVCQIIKKSIL